MNNIKYVNNIFSMDRPGIGLAILYMELEGLFFYTLLILAEVKN